MSENIFVRAFGSVGVLHVVMCIYMASTCTLTFVPKHNFFLYFLSEANTVSIRVFEKKNNDRFVVDKVFNLREFYDMN